MDLFPQEDNKRKSLFENLDIKNSVDENKSASTNTFNQVQNTTTINIFNN